MIGETGHTNWSGPMDALAPELGVEIYRQDWTGKALADSIANLRERGKLSHSGR